MDHTGSLADSWQPAGHADNWQPAGHADLSRFESKDVELAKSLPKVELHLHLDGSLSPEFIGRRALARNITLPVPPENLREFMMKKKLEKLHKDDNKADKGGNWPVFDFCNQFLQTKEELFEGTKDILQRLGKENVVYAEIRFCPHLHTLEGLSVNEVIESVIDGAKSQTAVKTGIILAALRSKDSEHGIEIAQLCKKYQGPDGVVGMDVAGDEGTYPLKSEDSHMFAGVMEAKKLGVPVTLHAGEWPEKFGSLGNLKWAIDNKIRRIGHGIAIRSDTSLVSKLKENGITIEVCLTSNIGNGFKVANYSVHPAKILQEEGAKFSLSSDNLLLSGDLKEAPSPTAEVLHLAKDVGVGWEAVRKSIIDGLEAAFNTNIDEMFITYVKNKIDDLYQEYDIID